MQYSNLGIVFLPLTFIALDLRVVIANRTQLPQYCYQFSIIYLFICLFVYLFVCLFVCLFIYLFIYLFMSLQFRESSFNMTKGDEDIETRSLKF